MDKKVVEELIQEDCNTAQISTNLNQIMDGKKRQTMLEDYEKLSLLMGKEGASECAAKLIVSSFA